MWKLLNFWNKKRYSVLKIIIETLRFKLSSLIFYTSMISLFIYSVTSFVCLGLFCFFYIFSSYLLKTIKKKTAKEN